MHPPVSAETKEGMRELRDLQPPTFPRIAKIAGVHVTTVREIASRENWPKLHVPKGTVMRVVSQKELREEAEVRAWVEALAAANDPLVKGDLAAGVSPGDVAAQIVEELQVILAGLRIGHIDKARIDAMLSAVRLTERVGNLNFHFNQQEQKRSDEELAEILAFIDRRIVELARDYAERLVARKYPA
jgi:hypothetical protein